MTTYTPGMTFPIANLVEIGGLMARGAHLYISLSAGKDSQAMYAVLYDYFPHDTN